MTETSHSESTPQPKARKSRKKFWIIGGALAALGIGIGAVHAQLGYGHGPGWGGQGYHRGEGFRGWRGGEPGFGDRRSQQSMRLARFCSNDTARFQPVARLYVKTDLRLSRDQEAAFDKLADTILPALEEVKREACGNFVARGGPAPERLEHLAAVLKKAAAAAESAVQPAKSFYAGLDNEQKARVEQLTERRGRGGFMGPSGPMGPGGPGPLPLPQRQ